MKVKAQSTIAQVNRKLRQLRNRLANDFDLELGIDQKQVHSLLIDLEGIRETLKKELGAVYTLETRQLKEVNLYFNLSRGLSRTVSFLKSIKIL